MILDQLTKTVTPILGELSSQMLLLGTLCLSDPPYVSAHASGRLVKFHIWGFFLVKTCRHIPILVETKQTVYTLRLWSLTKTGLRNRDSVVCEVGAEAKERVVVEYDLSQEISIVNLAACDIFTITVSSSAKYTEILQCVTVHHTVCHSTLYSVSQYTIHEFNI
jgi:hypothetical protein